MWLYWLASASYLQAKYRNQSERGGQKRRMHPMPPNQTLSGATSDERIENAASIMYAAALAFTNNIGRKGWAWEQCDEKTKDYWRNIARITRGVFQDT